MPRVASAHRPKVSQQAAEPDLFESSLSLEEQHIKEGYEQGLRYSSITRYQLAGQDSGFMKLTCAVVMDGRRAHRKDRNWAFRRVLS